VKRRIRSTTKPAPHSLLGMSASATDVSVGPLGLSGEFRTGGGFKSPLRHNFYHVGRAPRRANSLEMHMRTPRWNARPALRRSGRAHIAG
jgi:hypothetical protein